MRYIIILMFLIGAGCTSNKFYPIKVEYFKETFVIYRDTCRNTLDTNYSQTLRSIDLNCPKGF